DAEACLSKKRCFSLNPFDSITFISNLWRNDGEVVRKRNLVKTAELISYARTVLNDCPNAEELSLSAFGQTHYELLAKVDLIREVLLHEIVSSKPLNTHVPKWKGKSMQFIELISIGIELDLFEGTNQNKSATHY
ncbi:MAG TPA: hypothetical protein VGD31_00605, partial [Sphingobacteriaceae bacterium]